MTSRTSSFGRRRLSCAVLVALTLLPVTACTGVGTTPGATAAPATSSPAASPTPTATPTPTPTPTLTATPTPTPTPTPTVPAGRSCTAAYTVTSTWPGGFVATVRVTAGSQAIDGWAVSIGLPSGAVVHHWSSEVLSTAPLTLGPSAWNARLAAGGSTEIGFQGTGSPQATSVSCAAR